MAVHIVVQGLRTVIVVHTLHLVVVVHTEETEFHSVVQVPHIEVHMLHIEEAVLLVAVRIEVQMFHTAVRIEVELHIEV